MSNRTYANINGVALADLRVSPCIPELDKDRCAACAYWNLDMQVEPCCFCLDQVGRGRGYTGFVARGAACGS